ncbi:3'(2'),5'-bisphosphate nucleotidase CysQ [Acidiphilium sp.]|uniref:3'(2'),5'-bisphosphate nucleotidase CysQ n=1 Tax=Acidiphilium sp. TaxID=527 RepID=UPI00258F3E2A|nr:3'(2'),5'-bisphosphate nucleotidase CysQ [Acidiphilium sp.]
MNDNQLLELAASLAEAAGREILAVRAGGFTVDRKADETPVTIADTRAERVIVEGLRRAVPEIPVVAEEEVAAGRQTDPGRRFWLVDPLDGTREFAEGRDEFAVCIGLVVDGRPHLGAVGAPAQGAVYGGIVGKGAWRQNGAGRHPIAARTPPAEGITVYASRHYADDPQLAAYLARYKVAKLTNIGSALKFCRLAEGAADFYPRLGRTMEWDTAAPQAVLEAAGGCVVTMADETPLRYGKKGFENPHFLCFGRAAG